MVNYIFLMLCFFGFKPTNSLKQSLRREIILRQQNKCGNCMTSFTKMVPHEIHHLNHNPKDDNASNLLALCANCHAAHHRFGISVKPFCSTLNNTTSQDADNYNGIFTNASLLYYEEQNWGIVSQN